VRVLGNLLKGGEIMKNSMIFKHLFIIFKKNNQNKNKNMKKKPKKFKKIEA
jgi:hypothetical protein